MIRGSVNARREAIVPLRVRGATGIERAVDALVDTGFTASMAMPPSVPASLGLLRQSVSSAVLADGSVRQFEVYAVEVEWGGTWRPILVSAVGNEVLIGMRLLADHELRVSVTVGGDVRIDPIP